MKAVKQQETDIVNANEATTKVAAAKNTVASGLEKVANTLEERADSTAQSTKQRVEKVNELGHQMSDKVSEYGHQVTDKVSGYAQRTIDRVGQAGHQTAKLLNSSAEYVREFEPVQIKTAINNRIKEQPAISLLVAGAIGFVIGALIARRSA